jgi:hypothetical protein
VKAKKKRTYGSRSNHDDRNLRARGQTERRPSDVERHLEDRVLLVETPRTGEGVLWRRDPDGEVLAIGSVERGLLFRREHLEVEEVVGSETEDPLARLNL